MFDCPAKMKTLTGDRAAAHDAPRQSSDKTPTARSEVKPAAVFMLTLFITTPDACHLESRCRVTGPKSPERQIAPVTGRDGGVMVRQRVVDEDFNPIFARLCRLRNVEPPWRRHTLAHQSAVDADLGRGSDVAEIEDDAPGRRNRDALPIPRPAGVAPQAVDLRPISQGNLSRHAFEPYRLRQCRAAVAAAFLFNPQ